ncbi:hypothetical protein EDF58_1142 [Novosphingobium sp. PhB57]|nr:hypothetical protein EDF58_1142 [Novosphingobium sp. PhB57]
MASEATQALTAEYIDDHQVRVHTPESFGRALIYAALESAKGNTDGSKGTFDFKGTVTAITSVGCVRICVGTPWGTICTHIG